jgi:hypothetical protein
MGTLAKSEPDQEVLFPRKNVRGKQTSASRVVGLMLHLGASLRPLVGMTPATAPYPPTLPHRIPNIDISSLIDIPSRDTSEILTMPEVSWTCGRGASTFLGVDALLMVWTQSEEEKE